MSESSTYLRRTFVAPPVAAYALAAIVLLVPIAGVFAPKAIAPLSIFASLTGAMTVMRNGFERVPMPQGLGALLAAFSTWALLTSAWAPDFGAALSGAIRMTGNVLCAFLICVAALAIDRDGRLRLGLVLFVGWVLSLAVLCVELTFRGPIFSYLYQTEFEVFSKTVGPFWLTTGVAVLLILTWPIAFMLQRAWGWWTAVTAFIAMTWVAYQVRYVAGLTALAVGLAVGLLVRLFGRRAAVAIAALLVGFTLLIPVALPWLGEPAAAASRFEILPNAARHRIAIWTFTAQRIAEHPIAGWGMNASKGMLGGEEQIVDAHGTKLGMALPLHPHNAALQIWLELGLVGVLAYGALVVILAFMAARTSSAPWVTGQLFAALTIANVSYGIWQAWWIATLGFAAAMMIAVGRPSPSNGERIYL